MMDIKQYQEWTPTTAIYPEGIELEYLTLGLVGEIAEAEATKKPEDLLKEWSDVLWYTSQLCNLLKIKLSIIQEINITALRNNKMNSNVPHYAVCALMAEFCGTAKKYLRGDFSWDVLAGRMKKHLRELGSIITIKLYNLNPDIEGIEYLLDLNYRKLTQRQEKGTLQGDGDNR